LIRDLVIKTDNPRKEVILIEVRENATEYCLLHILHAGRFHGNNTRGLMRLRHKGNLYRYLCARFEEVNSSQLSITSPIGKEILTGREAGIFETFSPDHLTELLVSLKSISGRSWTVPWQNSPFVDISIYLSENASKEHVRHINKLSEISLRKFIVEQTDFLLTLDIVSNGS